MSKKVKFTIIAADELNWCIIRHHKMKNKGKEKVLVERRVGYFPTLEKACGFLQDLIIKNELRGKSVDTEVLLKAISSASSKMEKLLLTMPKSCDKGAGV